MGGRDDRDVIIVEQEGGSTIGWFLIGATVGAGLALLFAPATGEETRRRLRHKASELKDRAEEAIDDLKEEFDEFRDDVGERVAGVKEKVAVHASRALGTEDAPGRKRAGVAGARDELERRLAEARARRREPVVEDEEPVA
jgi:gas vesicle protein